jgi:hypothetical protein
MTLILKQSSLFANVGQINGSSIRSHEYHSLAAIMKKFLFAIDGQINGLLYLMSHDYHSLAAFMKKFLFANNGQINGASTVLCLMTIIR